VLLLVLLLVMSVLRLAVLLRWRMLLWRVLLVLLILIRIMRQRRLLLLVRRVGRSLLLMVLGRVLRRLGLLLGIVVERQRHPRGGRRRVRALAEGRARRTTRLLRLLLLLRRMASTIGRAATLRLVLILLLLLHLLQPRLLLLLQRVRRHALRATASSNAQARLGRAIDRHGAASDRSRGGQLLRDGLRTRGRRKRRTEAAAARGRTSCNGTAHAQGSWQALAHAGRLLLNARHIVRAKFRQQRVQLRIPGLLAQIAQLAQPGQ